MDLNKIYDVFIAYHGSYDPSGSTRYADKVYSYLENNGINCFYFPVEGNDSYRANIIRVMRSCTFLLICTSGLKTLPDGKIDSKVHYELSTEIDAFYALTQIGEAKIADAKVLACGKYYKGNEAKLHELFANRTHLYCEDDEITEKSLNEVLEWVKSHVKQNISWGEAQATTEVKSVFSTRSIMTNVCDLQNMIAMAKDVKAIGVSNTELTQRIGDNAIRNCINNGGKIEILFLTPNGKNTKIREKEEGLRSGCIKRITEYNLFLAKNLKSSLVTKDSFKLYLYDKLPRLNMIFVDNSLILQYYANNVAGTNNPTYLIKKDKNNSSIYDFCFNQYEYLKKEAKEIK